MTTATPSTTTHAGGPPGAPVDDEAAVAAARAALRFDAPVPRGLAHRASVAEVLPTDVVAVGADRYLVAAQIPRSHLLFNDGPGRFHDLLVVIEAARQAGTLLAHRFLDVPLDMAFVLQNSEVQILDPEALRVSPVPAQLIADMTLLEYARRDSGPVRISGQGQMTIDGKLAVRTTALMLAMPLRTYRTVRPVSLKDGGGSGSGVPAPPELVGRRNPGNVVITARRPGADGSPDSFTVLVDTGHPHFFDHPQDHVPGMLMIEACRQSAIALASHLLAVEADELLTVRCATSFHTYAELSQPVTVEVVPGVPELRRESGLVLPIEIILRQSGETVVTAELDVLHVP
jgi:hypothetical protein